MPSASPARREACTTCQTECRLARAPRLAFRRRRRIGRSCWGAGQGGRDGSGPWRQRGRRHRGGPAGARHGTAGFGTAGSDAGAAAATGAGAHQVFDHNRDGYATSITEATGGVGVDVVLEMLANVNLDRDLTLLAPKGRVVIIGNRGRIEIDPRLTMGKETAILARRCGPRRRRSTRRFTPRWSPPSSPACFGPSSDANCRSSRRPTHTARSSRIGRLGKLC